MPPSSFVTRGILARSARPVQKLVWNGWSLVQEASRTIELMQKPSPETIQLFADQVSFALLKRHELLDEQPFPAKRRGGF